MSPRNLNINSNNIRIVQEFRENGFYVLKDFGFSYYKINDKEVSLVREEPHCFNDKISKIGELKVLQYSKRIVFIDPSDSRCMKAYNFDIKKLEILYTGSSKLCSFDCKSYRTDQIPIEVILTTDGKTIIEITIEKDKFSHSKSRYFKTINYERVLLDNNSNYLVTARDGLLRKYIDVYADRAKWRKDFMRDITYFTIDSSGLWFGAVTSSSIKLFTLDYFEGLALLSKINANNIILNLDSKGSNKCSQITKVIFNHEKQDKLLISALAGKSIFTWKMADLQSENNNYQVYKSDEVIIDIIYDKAVSSQMVILTQNSVITHKTD